MEATETGPGTEHEAAIMEVLSVCKKVGKVPGKHCGSGAKVSARIAQGFQYLALSSDVGWMAKAARAEFEAVGFSGGGGDAGAEGKIYS